MNGSMNGSMKGSINTFHTSGKRIPAEVIHRSKARLRNLSEQETEVREAQEFLFSLIQYSIVIRGFCATHMALILGLLKT